MSFAPETENIVELAIKKEYENACEQYGDKYLCMQEMLQVLSEEVKEVYDELELAQNEVIKKQFLTKSYNTETLLKLENYARNAMKELAQVCAVLMKIKNTFGKDTNVLTNDEVEE